MSNDDGTSSFPFSLVSTSGGGSPPLSDTTGSLLPLTSSDNYAPPERSMVISLLLHNFYISMYNGHRTGVELDTYMLVSSLTDRYIVFGGCFN